MAHSPHRSCRGCDMSEGPAVTDRDMERIIADMLERHGEALRRLAEYDRTGRDPGGCE